MELWNIVVFVIFVVEFCNSMPSDVNYVLSIPDACRGKQYCPYKPEGYELLEEKMNVVLKQFLDTSMRSKRSTVDQGQPEILLEPQLPMLSINSDWHICPYVAERSLVYLINYLTEGGEETDIVVQTKELQQTFDMRSCANEYVPDGDEQYFQDLPLRTFALKSRCITYYVKRRVFVYNLKQNKIEIKHHDFPVSCSCELYHRT